MTKSIVFITGSRADYGIMVPLLRRLQDDSDIELKIVATGMHMEAKYGFTYRMIEKDGFDLYKRIPLNQNSSSTVSILHQITTLTNSLTDIYDQSVFDLTLILGDRYEMLAAAQVSLLNNIPICHLHGGEMTLGNYDESIRNAITKMSQLHLTSTSLYRKRVIQMGELPRNVINTGSLGVENVLYEKIPPLCELNKKMGVELSFKKYYVILVHSMTLKIDQNKTIIKNILKLVNSDECVFISSNSDTGSDEIMKAITTDVNQNKIHILFKSVPTEYFHSLVKNSKGLIGNSSSGIIEVPSLGVPTLNIGDRQKGRVQGPSVINVSGLKFDDLKIAIQKMKLIKKFVNPYEKENSSQTAYESIIKFISQKHNGEKTFYNIPFYLSN